MRQILFLGLVVIYAAVVTGSKPSFLVNFENVTAKEGSRLEIDCSALGDRPITYEWYNQYEDRITGDTNASIYVSNSENGSTLVIPNVSRSDEGTYTCTASNQLGLSSKVYMLTLLPSGIVDRPGALTQIVFHKVTPTTITFLFVGPDNTGGMPITHYHMNYKFAEQKDAPVKEETWERDAPYILRNLIPRAKYQFSATASNAVGFGDYIDAMYVMPEETVPEPPTIRTRDETVSEYPDRFEVRWDAPNDNGKPILRYGLRYFRVERSLTGWTRIENGFENTVHADVLSFEIEGLMPDSYYKIEITATNQIGNSLPASVVVKTGKVIGRPGALTEIIFHKVTPTTITFLFVGPNDTGGMPIIRYHMKYQLAEQEDAPVKGMTWHIDDTPYILSNLIPRAKYQFSAAALNAVAMGDEIDAIYVMPEETAPEPPVIRTRNETVSEYSDRFEVRWDAPNDNGKPLLRYGLRYFRVRRTIRAWMQIENGFESSVDADVLSFEMEGLVPDSYYKIEIRARNEIGNSMPASVVIKTGKGETNNTHIIVTNLRLPLIIVAAQVAVFVILVIVDVTSFFKCHCGLLYLARYRRCGRSVENV